MQIALWVLMAVLAAAAALVVLVPLSRGARAGAAAAPAMAIYRDQMQELDRDVARGVIAESEAEAARTEIARRLLRAGETGEPVTTGSPAARRAAAVVAVAAPLLAFAGYLALGSPEMPDQPLSARLGGPLEQQDVQTLVAKVETHLAAHPEDGSGWEVIGPVYLRLGRSDDAVRAFGNALRILGSTATRESSLGDAMVRANGGLVTADARAAFERALKIDPQAVAPRFYLAVALGQDGKKEEALAAWNALLRDASADAAWVPLARQWVERLGGAPAAAGSPAPQPGAADISAAEAMSPAQRREMIEGMVAQLAERLAASPDDAEGWARLVRSYIVLGRSDDARAALARARSALAGSPDRLSVVEAEARSAGIE